MAQRTSDFQPSDEERVERRSAMARALARGGMEGAHVISIETAREVLTPKRFEIIDCLRDGDAVESVKSLAERLDRDHGQVSRDLGVLAEHGIIDYERDGRSKRPVLAHEHLVVEPLA
jgi:predicted transcriptional regulator